MFNELRAATEHLSTLLVTSLAPEQKADFCKTLSERLQLRYSDKWFENDGERGSASRALHWHAHGGGEGLDDDVAFACRKHLQAAKPFLPSTLYRLFAMPFTMWIDPNCVAIRAGYGPGTYLSGITTLQQQQQQTLSGVKIVFGVRPTLAMPVHTIAPATVPPPVVNLMPSTPATISNACFNEEQSIKGQTAAPASTWPAMPVRSVSLGGSSRASSSGQSEACPSLVAPSSTRGDSESESYEDDDEEDGDEDNQSTSSELSIQDMIERRGFKNIDVIDDDDEDEQNPWHTQDETIKGDLTVQAIRDGGADVQNKASAQAKATSITSYDGGNVGVLGGGVRLGASKIAQPTMLARTPANRSKPSLLIQTQPPSQWSSSAAMPSPLSPAAAAAFSPYMSATGHPQQSQHLQYPASPQFVMIDGCLMPMSAGMMKRGRVRGRRSRGRGAGRAARRQAAAALKAQQGQGHYQQYNGAVDVTGVDEAGYFEPYVKFDVGMAPVSAADHDGSLPSALGISLNGTHPCIDNGNGAKMHGQYDAPSMYKQPSYDLVRHHRQVPNSFAHQHRTSPRPGGMNNKSLFTPKMQATPPLAAMHPHAFASPAMHGLGHFDPTMQQHQQQQHQQHQQQQYSAQVHSHYNNAFTSAHPPHVLSPHQHIVA